MLLTSINTDGKSFTLNKKPEHWYNANENDINFSRDRNYLAFYFDGNVQHLPDYIIISPAYKVFTDNNIHLKNEISKEIMDKIIPYKTIVMNHYDSNNYDYSAGNGEVPCDKWKIFEAKYNGFSFGGVREKFRTGTKSVKPILFCNYHQDKDAVLEIRNVEIKEIDRLKFD